MWQLIAPTRRMFSNVASGGYFRSLCFHFLSVFFIPLDFISIMWLSCHCNELVYPVFSITA